MSKGTQVVTLRLDAKTLEAVKWSVDKRNNGAISPVPWDVSSWIRKAIEDKLAHDERSRRRRERRFPVVDAAVDDMQRKIDEQWGDLQDEKREAEKAILRNCLDDRIPF